MIKMCLLNILIWLIIYLQVSTALSNDIASLHCKLLCKEAGGVVQDLLKKNVCKCTVDHMIIDAKLRRLEDLSSKYKLALILVHNHQNKQVKRQLNNNLLDDLRLSFEQSQPLWFNNANEITSNWNKHKEQFEEDIKSWQRNQLDNIFEDVAPQLEAYKQEFDNTLRSWRAQQENSWLDGVIPNLEEQRQEWEDALKTWQEDEAPMLLGQIAPTWEQQQQEFQEQQEDLQEKLQEYLGSIKSHFSRDQHDQTFGQMPPMLTNYAVKDAGIGGSIVNYPKPIIPNPGISQLNSIFRVLPIPHVNLQPYADPLGARMTRAQIPLLQQRAAPFLPARLNTDPQDPIVVRPLPIQMPSAKPNPMLEILKKPIEQVMENMTKMNVPHVPPNLISSDSLPNSEGQGNHINVNVSVEPTSTPPNLYSLLFPYRSLPPFLTAPLPELIAREIEFVTEIPGESPSKEHDAVVNDDSEKNRDENKSRLQTQLTNATRSKFEPHVVDSVKKSHPDDGKPRASAIKQIQKGGIEMNNPSIIVQPAEFMDGAEEDLQTLA